MLPNETRFPHEKRRVGACGCDARRYDGIIFDVGGTLIGMLDPAPFQEFLNHAGLPATDEDTRSLHRSLMSVILAERDSVQGLGVDEADLYAWWRQVFRRTWPERPDLAEEMYRWWRRDHFDRVFPDAVPALKALRELGISLAVLSNYSADLGDLLHRLGLDGYFDFVIVSAVVGLAKPDPRIFDLAVARAGHARHRLLYVGDHVGDDIEGAEAASLDVVLIDRLNRQPEALCARIGSLLDLVDYVQYPTQPARAIIFELDGVLLDSMPLHLLAWQRALAPLGILVTAEDLYALEGMSAVSTAQRLTERFLGQACSEEEAQRLAAAQRAHFRQVFQPTYVQGVRPLLHDLRGRGYCLGLVTGSARGAVDESLAPTGVADLFDAIVTGDEVCRRKPDPDLYQVATVQLSLRPAECLAVENAPLGIQSAKGAGVQCVALETTLPARMLSAADRVFPNAQSLRSWLLFR